MAGELVEKLRRFLARFGSGEIAFHREDVLAQPGEKFALAARDGRILWQMRVTIDQSGENDRSSAIDPANRLCLWASTKIVVIARFQDPAIFDEEGAVAPATQGTEIRGVDEEASNPKQVAVAVHRNPHL